MDAETTPLPTISVLRIRQVIVQPVGSTTQTSFPFYGVTNAEL